MNIYFTASLSGKGQYLKHYQAIIKAVRKLGHKLTTDNVTAREPDDVWKETDIEAEKYYKKMLAWIKKADIVIAEVSYPSTGVGYEASLALNEGKPVIALHVKGKEAYLLEGSQLDKLQVVEYEIGHLSKILKRSIEEAKDTMDVRFNFFVSPKIVHFLDWISKTKKMPRAVYLRRLIESDMKKFKEYQKKA